MIGQLGIIDILTRFVTDSASEGVKVTIRQAAVGQIGQQLTDVLACRLIVSQFDPDFVAGELAVVGRVEIIARQGV